MKKILTFLLFLSAVNFFAQVMQKNAPWVENTYLKNKQNSTLAEVKAAAITYFNSINKYEKGSGLKPFERWNYHWNYYTNPDGKIKPAEDLWRAWEQKNQMNANQARADESNWTSIGPYSHTNTGSWSPGQGRINAITIDPSNPNTYYVGAPAGGIWKSTDGGIQWSPLTDYLPQIGVSGIAVDPNNSQIIYIATGDDDASDSYSVGVYKSTDGGASWNPTGAISGNPNSMNDIFVHPDNSDILMVATSTGVHKSTDGGTSWTKSLINGFVNDINIRDLKMKPNSPTVWYATSNNSFYKSVDSGENFTEIAISNFSDSRRIVMDVTIANPNYVYFVSAGSGYSFNGVYKSTDSGETFTKTLESTDIFESTQAWFDLALTVSDTDAERVFVGCLNVWGSTNGGDNFIKLNNWNSPEQASYTHADIHIMRFIDGKFFVGSDGGIYISNDHGVNFTDLTENLAISQFYRISVSKQNSGNIVGGLQDNGGYAFSDNNWKNYHGADGMDAAVSAVNPNTYYGFIQYGGSLIISNNAGLTRDNIVSAPSAETGPNDSGGEWVTPMVSDSEGNIYAGYKQLYKLVDGAWAQVSNHAFGDDLDIIEIDPNNDNNIYVTNSNVLYRSTDAGITFRTILISPVTINSIEINNTNSNIAYLTTNEDVRKSENILASTPIFTDITSNLPSESKLVIKHHKRSGKNTLYLGTTLGVYFLNDDSPNWEVFDNNLPNVAIRDLEIHEEDSKLFAATYGRGIFSSPIPKILPASDIKLVDIQNPLKINCANTFTPKIAVINKGLNDITEITVNYILDGTNSNYTWSGTLVSEATTTIELPSLTLDTGSHYLKVETIVINDAYDSNNEKEVTFIVNNTNNDPTIINSFEDTNNTLLTETIGADNDVWELGIPYYFLLNTTSSGSNAYVTGLEENYPDLTTSYLYSKCIDLSSISNPVLSFQMAFDIEENWDYLTFEYSTNDGKTWSILGNASDPNWYNSSSTENNIPGAQWTGEGEDANSRGGTNATLREYSYDLAAFTSEPKIVFRFKFFADQATNEEGVLIDDWVINGTVLSLNNETLQNTFSVYPNPSNDTFNLSWSENGVASIVVYDYTGKLITKKDGITNNEYKLSLNGFSKGLYFAKISVNGKQATKKLILE